MAAGINIHIGEGAIRLVLYGNGKESTMSMTSDKAREVGAALLSGADRADQKVSEGVAAIERIANGHTDPTGPAE